MDTAGSGPSLVAGVGEPAPGAADLQAPNRTIAHAATPALERKILGAMGGRYHAPTDRDSELATSGQFGAARDQLFLSVNSQ